MRRRHAVCCGASCGAARARAAAAGRRSPSIWRLLCASGTRQYAGMRRRARRCCVGDPAAPMLGPSGVRRAEAEGRCTLAITIFIGPPCSSMGRHSISRPALEAVHAGPRRGGRSAVGQFHGERLRARRLLRRGRRRWWGSATAGAGAPRAFLLAAKQLAGPHRR